MKFPDILRLALRNLREARLRAGLTTLGVIVGVSMIVSMMSFGLGLQRNAVQRFRDLDLFNEITVSGRSLVGLVSSAMGDTSEEGRGDERGARRRRGQPEAGEQARTLTEAALAEIAQVPGVASVEPNIDLTTYVRANGRVLLRQVGGVLPDRNEQLLVLHVPDRLIRGTDRQVRKVRDELAEPDIRRELAQPLQFVQNLSARGLDHGRRPPTVGN